MKIKESLTSIKIKNLIPCFAGAFIVCLILRCVQMATVIESTTGFYTKSSIVTSIFDFIMVISCSAFAVFSYLSADSKNIAVRTLKGKGLFASTLLFSVALFYDAFSSFSQSIIKDTQTGYVENRFASMMSSGALPLMMQSLFAIVSAIYILILAKSFLKGDAKASKRKIMALAPVCWVIFRLIFLFVRKISFRQVSDLFYELIMLGFAALFFMALAQVESNVYSEGFGWRIIGFGLPAGLIAGVLSVSRLIFTLINSTEYINPEHLFRLSDLFFAVFVFALCARAVKCLKSEQTEVSALEPTDESIDGENT